MAAVLDDAAIFQHQDAVGQAQALDQTVVRVFDGRPMAALSASELAVEARGTLRRMTPDLQLAGVDLPPSAVGECLQPVFEHWALDLLTNWAAGKATFLARE